MYLECQSTTKLTGHQSAPQEVALARNKRHLDPKIKKEDIELVATALFKEKGYENTSMGEIARSAGVAANTIYWYFEIKDDVLSAVLSRVVSQAMAEVVALRAQPLRTSVLKLIAFALALVAALFLMQAYYWTLLVG